MKQISVEFLTVFSLTKYVKFNGSIVVWLLLSGLVDVILTGLPDCLIYQLKTYNSERELFYCRRYWYTCHVARQGRVGNIRRRR